MSHTPTSASADTLSLTTARKSTPAWLRAASKGNGRCKACKTQYLRGELNTAGHCRHCADELGEAHPLNAEVRS